VIKNPLANAASSTAGIVPHPLNPVPDAVHIRAVYNSMDKSNLNWKAEEPYGSLGQRFELKSDDFPDGFSTSAVEVDNPLVRGRCFYLVQSGGIAGMTMYAGPFKWSDGSRAAQVSVNPMPEPNPDEWCENPSGWDPGSCLPPGAVG
jgi:hypothetical protein